MAAGSSSRRSDASLTLRSARMRCHLLSFSGKSAFTRTSSGPLPTSKEKRTSVEATSGKEENQDLLYIFNKVPSEHSYILSSVSPCSLFSTCSTCRQARCWPVICYQHTRTHTKVCSGIDTVCTGYDLSCSCCFYHFLIADRIFIYICKAKPTVGLTPNSRRIDASMEGA